MVYKTTFQLSFLIRVETNGLSKFPLGRKPDISWHIRIGFAPDKTPLAFRFFDSQDIHTAYPEQEISLCKLASSCATGKHAVLARSGVLFAGTTKCRLK